MSIKVVYLHAFSCVVVALVFIASFFLQTINAFFTDFEPINVVEEESIVILDADFQDSLNDLEPMKTAEDHSFVRFPNNSYLSDEGGKKYSLSEFVKPTKMDGKFVSTIQNNVPKKIRDQILSVYSIGPTQKVFVKDSLSNSPANAIVTLPVSIKSFSSEVEIYSSNDGIHWSFHNSTKVDTHLGQDTVSFTTNHFTYFLLADVIGTFVVDGDAAFTTSASTTLSIDSPDAVLMKISNTYTGLNNASWQPYQTTTGWVLSSGNGYKTVHALFQNSLGETGYVSDTILLQDNYVLPVLSSPGTVPTPNSVTTKTFTFTSNNEGTLVLTGGCSGTLQTPIAVSGSNTITFGTLSVGTYSDCAIYLVDPLGATSNTLSINAFTITTPVGGVPGSFGGLKLWLDASDPSTLSLAGNRVTQWRDKSGNSNHVSPPGAANRPSRLTANLNSLDTINFVSNDTLRTTTGSLIGANANYTKFAVVKLDNAVGYNTVLYGNGHSFEFSPSTSRPALYHISTFLASSLSIGTTDYAIVVATYNPSQQNNIYVNGVLQASNTLQFNFTDTGPAYVGSYAMGDYLDGRVGELGMYNQPLNDTERQSIECYLSEKWGIALGYSCSDLQPPVLSNPSSIVSPVTGSSVSFSFVSTQTGDISLYGNCNGFLQLPITAEAISGVNNITIGLLSNNIDYNNCSVSVTNPSSGISNVLGIPSFTVNNNLSPFISSGSPFNTTMLSYEASLSFVVNQPGLIGLAGSCATGALTPPLAVSGSNVVSFAYLPVGTYTNCALTVTNNSGFLSNVFVFTSFTIIEQASVSLGAPLAVTISGAEAASFVYNVDYMFTGMFTVNDKSGINTGWYTTIQSLPLSGNYGIIPASNVSMVATGLVTVTGSVNTNVQIDSSLQTYYTIDSPVTYIYRNSGNNYGRKGIYGNYPLLRINIPSYPKVDSYQGTLLFTLYDL